MSQTKQHLSIGEVLKTLREEFADISISKIRFLETEGLVDPERTASGYRKFYPADLARLRYILRLQRDHFMPLKVIRKRLQSFDPADEPTDEVAVPEQLAALQNNNGEELIIEGGLHLNFEDFLSSTGLSYDETRELEEFGLIDSHALDTGELYYDEDDLQVAKMAKQFSKYGIQPRHLKMYRNFAEKEAGLFEQVVVPISRTGGTEGRRNANQSLEDLAKLSKQLKHVLLRASLKDVVGNAPSK